MGQPYGTETHGHINQHAIGQVDGWSDLLQGLLFAALHDVDTASACMCSIPDEWGTKWPGMDGLYIDGNKRLTGAPSALLWPGPYPSRLPKLVGVGGLALAGKLLLYFIDSPLLQLCRGTL